MTSEMHFSSMVAKILSCGIQTFDNYFSLYKAVVYKSMNYSL